MLRVSGSKPGRARAIAASIAAVGCSPPPAQPPHAIILISLDTLRPDHLGHYGYDRPTSPHLDRFAAGATIFERAVSTASWTLPAHASMFLSQYPHVHGVTDSGRRIPLTAETLAERLAGAGYRTGAFYNVGLLSEKNGFDQGFEHHERVDGMGRRRDAAVVNRKALEWIAEDSRPFFLFLHYFDVHDPYDSHVESEASFCSQGADGPRSFGSIQEAVLARFLRTKGIAPPSAPAGSPRDRHRRSASLLKQAGGTEADQEQLLEH